MEVRVKPQTIDAWELLVNDRGDTGPVSQYELCEAMNQALEGIIPVTGQLARVWFQSADHFQMRRWMLFWEYYGQSEEQIDVRPYTVGQARKAVPLEVAACLDTLNEQSLTLDRPKE